MEMRQSLTDMQTLRPQDLITTISLRKGFQAVIDATNRTFFVTTPPSPFIDPPLSVRPEERDYLRLDSKRGSAANIASADVVFIRAKAAVGKSTLAQKLAAEAHVPMLDLARNAIGVGSFNGTFPDFTVDGTTVSGRAAFRSGAFSVIIDAIDEGRLRATRVAGDRDSASTGFEAFLQDVWSRLAERDEGTERPGVVFLGRPEAVDFVRLHFELEADERLRPMTLSVDFFDEAGARKMVAEYAEKESRRRIEANLSKHEIRADNLGTAVKATLDKFFQAIADALKVTRENLWLEANGRQFAGYSPVLRTLGVVVGGESNPSSLASRLDSSQQAAWGVIDYVCQSVFDREQGILVTQLKDQIGKDKIPTAAYELAYSKNEQVRALVAWLSGKIDVSSSLGELSSTFGDLDALRAYHQQVNDYIVSHPFGERNESRDEFLNPILGSILMVEAIILSLDIDFSNPIFRSITRKPFIWQAIDYRRQDQRNDLIRGDYFGIISISRDAWNYGQDADEAPDPQGMARLKVEPTDGLEESLVSVIFKDRAPQAVVELLGPVHLGPEIQNLELDLAERTVILEGSPVNNEVRFAGDVRIVADTIEFRNCTAVVGEDGARVELAARSTHSDSYLATHGFTPRSATLPVRSADEAAPPARLYAFGDIAKQFPWSDFDAGAQGRRTDDDHPVNVALERLLDAGNRIRVDRQTFEPRNRPVQRLVSRVGGSELLRFLVNEADVIAEPRSAGGPATLDLRTGDRVPTILKAIAENEPWALNLRARLAPIVER